MYTMGLDIGSAASKALILEDCNKIVAAAVVNAGTGTSGPQRALKEVFEKSGLSLRDIKKTVVTGYGRMTYKAADEQISELSCHARGTYFLIPSARTIIDIGGQDAKVLKLDNSGRLMEFVMNDKCAAGTGRFLDVMANVLEIGIGDMAMLSEKSQNAVNISSTCTVFAESEVISHLANGAGREDVCAGIHRSIAKRIAGLSKRMEIEEDLVMTGGVANNFGVVRAVEDELKFKIKLPSIPQLTGALGAALYGCR